MIEAIDLTVCWRGRTVLDAVNFDVRPGQVTGVLGGAGAGKTVLLRRMVELCRGDGETLFDGRPYHALRHPMREVGLLLGLSPGDPDRTVRGHLRLILATDRGAAREGAAAGVRSWSGAAMTATAHGLGDGVRVAASRQPTADRGEARRAYAAARSGQPEGRTAVSAGAGLDAADFALGAQDRDARRDIASDVADLTAYEDLFRTDELVEPGRRSGGSRRRGRGLWSGRDRDRSAGQRHQGLDRGRRHDPAEPRDSAVAAGIEAARRGRPASRIDAVLDLVGLGGHDRTRLSELTEGMATRLGIAAALLGDPKALLLDCPDRGLEPEGVAWLGALLRAFTAQGRAALITGADTDTLVAMADRILLLDSGRLVGTRTAQEVLRAPTGASVVVRSPQVVRLASILGEAGARSSQSEGACLEVHGLDRARVGDLAFRHGIPIHELSERLTGSDPGDLVLAACSRRGTGAVVPMRAFPGAEQAADSPTLIEQPARTRATVQSVNTAKQSANTANVAAPNAVRAGGFEPTGTVRVISAPPDAVRQAAHEVLVPPATPASATPTSSAQRSASAAVHGDVATTRPAVAPARTPPATSSELAARPAAAHSPASTNADARSGSMAEAAFESTMRSGWRAARSALRRTSYSQVGGAADFDDGVIAVWAAPTGQPGQTANQETANQETADQERASEGDRCGAPTSDAAEARETQ